MTQNFYIYILIKYHEDEALSWSHDVRLSHKHSFCQSLILALRV